LFDLPYPPAAVAAAKKLANGVVYMLHPMSDEGVLDSTWGGSLADMVRFVEEMKIVEDEGLLEAVGPKSERLIAGLDRLVRRYPQVYRNRRGLGLYQGFSLADAVAKGEFLERAREEEQLLLLGAGRHSIRLRPPLDVTEAEIDELIARLDRLAQRTIRAG